MPLFLDATRHEDPGVRSSAVYALRDERAKQAVPALLDRLNDDDEDIRTVDGAAPSGSSARPKGRPGDSIECLEDDEVADASERRQRPVKTSEPEKPGAQSKPGSN